MAVVETGVAMSGEWWYVAWVVAVTCNLSTIKNTYQGLVVVRVVMAVGHFNVVMVMEAVHRVYLFANKHYIVSSPLRSSPSLPFQVASRSVLG